ncbi:MAG: CYTH domain-containing protein [Gemmatimonadaceae bacterium]
MREVELKAVVDDWDGCCRRVSDGGGTLVFAGRLEDRRLDTPARDFARREEVIRLRIYRGGTASRAELGWKGPTEHASGYKVREEIQTAIPEPHVVAQVLERIGLVVTRVIDREIAQYDVAGATVRFERYPRMDDLVEVEGSPENIERAIAVLGIAREAFTSERLPKFVRRYQERTGQQAALCDEELDGIMRYDLEDA